MPKITIEVTPAMAQFLNKFEDKNDLISFLLSDAKKEYDMSKLYFENSLATVAASKKAMMAKVRGIILETEDNIDINSPIDRLLLKEFEVIDE